MISTMIITKAITETTKLIEFFKKEKFVGSALITFAYLVINPNKTFRKINDNKAAATNIPNTLRTVSKCSFMANKLNNKFKILAF